MYDGGSDITGYVIQYAEAKDEGVGDEEWIKCSIPARATSKQYTVDGLTENKEYYLR